MCIIVNILFFILVSFFLDVIESHFLFSPIFVACCAFSINYPKRQQQQQRNFLYLHKQYHHYSFSHFAYVLSFCYRDNINELFLFFSLSRSFFLLFGTISLIYVFLSRFFFSLSFLLYYTCLVRVGANLTYACRDRYAHTYTYIQLKLHLVRV